MVLAFASPILAAGLLVVDLWEPVVVLMVALLALVLLVGLDIRARMASRTGIERLDRATGRLDRSLRNTEQRLVGAVETDRVEFHDRFNQLQDVALAASEGSAEAIQRVRNLDNKVSKRLIPQQTQQVEALIQLYNRFQPRSAMPPAGGFALNPAGILGVVELIRKHEPGLVLELGSGTSSIWIGYALELLSPGGKLVTVDHDPEYAQLTRSYVSAHCLDAVVEVRNAPLQDCGIPDHETPWYAVRALSDLDEIDLLIVDGPPQATGPAARLPALYKLRDQLSSSATLLLDDVDRPAEQSIAETWLRDCPGLSPRPGHPDFTMREFEYQVASRMN